MLNTERMILRDYNNDDFSFLVSLLADEQMVRFIGTGKPKNTEEAREFLEWIYSSYEKHKDFGLKIIELKETHELIGHAGLVPQKINDQEQIEIGYWIKEKYWGQGLATEVAKALKEYGENELHIHKMIALIQSGNLASQKVAFNIGMKKESEIVLKEKGVNVFVTVQDLGEINSSR